MAFGQANGTFEPPAFEIANFGSSDAAGGWSSENTYPRFAADVTGDHLADLVGFGSSGVFVAQPNWSEHADPEPVKALNRHSREAGIQGQQPAACP